jgi:hypothetical protein
MDRGARRRGERVVALYIASWAVAVLMIGAVFVGTVDSTRDRAIGALFTLGFACALPGMAWPLIVRRGLAPPDYAFPVFIAVAFAGIGGWAVFSRRGSRTRPDTAPSGSRYSLGSSTHWFLIAGGSALAGAIWAAISGRALDGRVIAAGMALGIVLGFATLYAGGRVRSRLAWRLCYGAVTLGLAALAVAAPLGLFLGSVVGLSLIHGLSARAASVHRR